MKKKKTTMDKTYIERLGACLKRLQNRGLFFLNVLVTIVIFLFCLSELAYLVLVFIDLCSGIFNYNFYSEKLYDNLDNRELQAVINKPSLASFLVELALNNIINLLLFIEILETFNATVQNLKDDENLSMDYSWVKVIFLVSIAAVLRNIITIDFTSENELAIIGPSLLVIILTISYIGMSYWFKKFESGKK